MTQETLKLTIYTFQLVASFVLMGFISIEKINKIMIVKFALSFIIMMISAACTLNALIDYIMYIT